MPSSLSSYLELRYWVNHRDNGFEHVYPLLTGNLPTAEQHANLIMTAHCRLLGGGVLFPYAVIRTVGRPFYTLTPNGYEFKPSGSSDDAAFPVADNINDLGVGLLVFFDTGAGRGVNRLFRGIRDRWVDDNKLTFSGISNTAFPQGTGTYLGGTNPPTYNAVAGDTDIDGVNNFLSIIRDYTGLISKRKAPLTGWDMFPFDVASGGGFSYVRIGKKKVGQRWSASRGRQAAFA